MADGYLVFDQVTKQFGPLPVVAPRAVTHIAPTAQAKRAARSSSHPWTRPARKPAAKQSPAPVASTAPT